LQNNVAKAVEKSKRITGTRGSGTQIWIDTASAKDAIELQSHLRQNGILVQLNSTFGVVTKPALILDENHASALPKALSKF
jgi:acetylornithine/succinyldiaminopimelate/putrescine aminotransferase